MKKKISAIILGVVLALTMASCSGDNYTAIDVEGRQDTSYVVNSNGGAAVQYGNYVYFVNGNRGYDDADGKANVWGEVVKGGLYRAELIGKDVTGPYGKDFEPAADETTGLEFKSVKGLDVNENVVDKVSAQVIAPKTIGTSGYAGGITIFDDYVYYASPNNQQNKAGVVQSSKTDFFRTKLDGSKTQKIFTTVEDSADKPYGFYKYGGNVYLVALDGTTLKSVKVGARKQQIVIICENVTSAYIPERPVYYNGIGENGVENFVYFTREADQNQDDVRSGTVLEFARPDGKERTVFLANGQTSSIEAVRDGLVFYRTVNGISTVIRYTNLHNVFLTEHEPGKFNSPTYEAAPAYDGHIEGETISRKTETLTGYKSTYCFRPNLTSDVTYALYATDKQIVLAGNGQNVVVYAGTANVKLVAGNDVYFTDSDETNVIYSTNMYVAQENKGDDEAYPVKKELTGNTTIKGPGLDTAAGYLVYFAELDEYAADYTFFYKINGYAGQEAKFIGERSPADVKTADSEEGGDTEGTDDTGTEDTGESAA